MDIERFHNFKYLGIYADEILHWYKHVEYVCNSPIKLYKSNVLSFVNEILSGWSDLFQNYFILKNNQYDMRRKGQLNIPPCRTQICDKAVRVFEAC